MTTTHFFVELLVIGFGGLAWVALFAAALVGFDLAGINAELFTSVSLLPLLSFVYLLGILVDRTADRWLKSADKLHRLAHFGQDQDAYFETRRVMVMYAPQLWAHLEYGRSRLRICRGWVINAILMLVALDVWLVSVYDWRALISARAILVNLALAGLAWLCFWSWAALNRKEYMKIHRQGGWVRETILKEARESNERSSDGGTEQGTSLEVESESGPGRVSG